jgi:hypothetical protein
MESEAARPHVSPRLLDIQVRESASASVMLRLSFDAKAFYRSATAQAQLSIIRAERQPTTTADTTAPLSAPPQLLSPCFCSALPSPRQGEWPPAPSPPAPSPPLLSAVRPPGAVGRCAIDTRVGEAKDATKEPGNTTAAPSVLAGHKKLDGMLRPPSFARC